MRPVTLTLRRRVVLTLLPLLAIVLGLGVAGTVLLRQLGGRADEILRENYASVVAMERLNESLERVDSSFQFALAGQQARAAGQYDSNWTSFRSNLSIEQGNITLPRESESVERLATLTERYRALGDAFYRRPPHDPQRERDYFDRGGLLDVFKELKAVSGEIREMNQANMEEASRRAKTTAATSVTGLGLGLVAAIVLAVFLAWLTTRALVRPLKELTRSAVAISEGDLTKTVSYAAADELGELAKAFNHMVGQIRQARHALENRNEDLREAEAKYRSIFENAVEGIFQSTPDGRFLTVNHALADMLGYESGNDLKRSVRHIGEELYADRSRRIEFSRRLVHDGVVRDFEAEWIRKDGTPRWLASNTRAVRDAGGALIFYEGFVTDVTARKKAERELARSEGNLKRAQEIAHVGSWHLDVVRNHLTWSDEVFRIFGVRVGAELTYDDFLAAVHPDDRKRVDAAWTAAMDGAPYDIEHRILVTDQRELKWVRERAEVTFDAERKAIEGVGTVQDVTERRLAEERLRQLNRAHRALSSSNHALVRATDEPAWMGQICRLVVEEAGYRLCWVGRAEHDEAKSVRPIASAGFDEGYLESVRVSWADTERGRGPTGACVRTASIVVARDIAKDPHLAPWRPEALKRGYASSIAIPILVDGQVFGALTIYASEPDAFAEAEVSLLTELADDLAFGIATLRARADRARTMRELQVLNAELETRVAARTADLKAAHEREATVGARIQQQLLLDVPPRGMPGLELAALTVPSARIAGDFYGFFRHEGKYCIDLLVADVMGKGVPAALLAAAAKSHFPEALWQLLATPATPDLPEPQEIVTLAHTRLARQLIDIESFVTLCYSRIDVVNRRLSFVDCGHTGILHLHGSTGECEYLHGDNVPLGVREGEIFGQVTVPLEREDVLVFYSDGVTESRDRAGKLFGEERLMACVRKNSHMSPSELVGAVRDDVIAFSEGRALPDDLTCVVAKLVPYEAPVARADLEIGSALGELRRARDFVDGFCRQLAARRVAADRVASLVLAVDEAAANVMKHAYHGRTDQHIDLTAEAFPDRVAIRLRYQGAPFDPSTVPPPSFDGSRESGFGLFMIAQSVDGVRYYKDDLQRSCIRLEQRREAA